MGYSNKKSKRTLTPEQLQKMKEGRERVQKEREDALKTKKRVDMLADLEKQLAEGRKSMHSKSNVRLKSRRRRVYSK